MDQKNILQANSDSQSLCENEKSTPGCGFCNIRDRRLTKYGEIEIIWEGERLFAFHDHKLGGSQGHIELCPKECIKNINFLERRHVPMLKEMRAQVPLLKNRFFGDAAQVRTGFHIPPFYSIKHLHLHVMAEPIRGCWNNRIVYSCFMRSLDTVIAKLESKK